MERWIPKMRVWADNNPGSGLNNALRGFLQALQHLGATADDVLVIPLSNSTGLYQEIEGKDPLHEYIYQPVKDDLINLVLHHPSHLSRLHTSANSRYNVCYCPWETHKLPQQYVDAMNQYDQVWAPSTTTADTYRRSGVTKPVHVVPHALQQEFLDGTTDWASRPNDTRYQHDGCLFYFIGSTNPRKNPEGLIRPWCQSIDRGWSRQSPVCLTLHLVPPSRDLAAVEQASEVTRFTVEQYVKSLGDKRDRTPPWRLLMAPRKLDYIINMHMSNDAFISASRGESFSLAATEAAAVGNVVVASPCAAPGLFDIPSWREHGYWLDARETPIAPMPEIAGYELDQNWWEPQSILDAFEDTYENLSAYKSRAMAYAEDVREALAPATVAKAIEPLLREAVDVLARSGW